jgi:uracil-DNA glycosylase
MPRKNLFGNRWDEVLQKEISKSYFVKLLKWVKKDRSAYTVYPSEDNMFRAFQATSFEDVKVVILGQDPYHGKGQAHGLSFSVPDGVAIPRSLKNIFKEIKSDLGFEIPESGNLEGWAKQGVLLLNTILTVRENNPRSHHNMGWETFTDEVVQTLSDKREHLIFILWGNDAKNKMSLINPQKHLILSAAHPSPFSAARGFFGCKHFSQANVWLKEHGLSEIDWHL